MLILDQCARAGVRSIEMYRGDAMLRPENFFPLIAYATSNNIKCSLPVNSLLLDEETARELVRAGTKVTSLSLDDLRVSTGAGWHTPRDAWLWGIIAFGVCFYR